MRPPEELDTIEWTSLHHAYGDGSDVPGWIQALYSGNADQAVEATEKLFNRVLHQGSVYPATVAAVPFLAHAAVHAVHQRPSALAFLAGAGGQSDEPECDDEKKGGVQVATEVAGLLHLLADDNPKVRRQAIRVARRATGETVPAALRALTVRYETDPVVRIRSEALTILTRLDPDPRSVHQRLHAALTDPVAIVRATAALALLERAHAPYPADLVAILADAGGGSEFSPFNVPFFPGVGTNDERVELVLAEDADAAAVVARSWIAQGDVKGQGWRRADELSATWRDRENDTIVLLAAALPYKKELWDLAQLLHAIGRWLPGATHPDPALGDNLLPHALVVTEALTNDDAQQLLGRLGDERLLTTVPDPSPAGLVALAARTGRLDHQRLAFLCRPATSFQAAFYLNELLATLTPDTARPLLPELKNVLDRHPTTGLARRFGDWGIRDTEVLGLLDKAARCSDDKLAIVAAVSAARLGADPDPALRLLEHSLSRNGFRLEDAGRLGPAAAPLLPLIERYRDSDWDMYDLWNPMQAAEAHWLITGDASRAVPVLTAIAGPSPVGVRALQTLLQIGPPFPPHLRPQLHHWSTSKRRLVPNDNAVVDDQLREYAERMLA